MICPGCFKPASVLMATREGDRCRTCKSMIVDLPPAEKKSRYRVSRAGRAKVIGLLEAQLWEDIRDVMKTDPKLRDQFNKGQVVAYHKAISYLSKYKIVSGKNNGTQEISVPAR